MMNFETVPACRAGCSETMVLHGEDLQGQVCNKLPLYLITALAPSSMLVVLRFIEEHGWTDDISRVDYLQAVQGERAEYINASVHKHRNVWKSKTWCANKNDEKKIGLNSNLLNNSSRPSTFGSPVSPIKPNTGINLGDCSSKILFAFPIAQQISPA
jgi:hypothetical protein